MNVVPLKIPRQRGPALTRRAGLGFGTRTTIVFPVKTGIDNTGATAPEPSRPPSPSCRTPNRHQRGMGTG